MEIIDLTRPISKPILGTSLNSHGAHSCTRLDAPALLLKEGKTVDLLPPNRFMGNAVLLDLTHKKPSDLIDDEDLEGAEERAGLTAREGEIVIIHTGWAWSSHNHPGLSVNGAEYLEFKRVAMVGIDTSNLDHSDSEDLPAHQILLGKEILVVENLCNLERLAQERFRIIALPLNVRAEVSLVRAIAMVDDSG